uniref:RILP-like protein 1 n=1 Tax=Neogobius melanostomus TaxID=47308 RepID=A0A8C6UWL3_9GOBI
MESCSVSALDRPAQELSVVDVYDIAALLGHEFERVIDRYGCEAMVGVVPKVVRVLELLEALVNYGGARHKAEELQGELDRLRQERTERSEHERKHQMELECVEDVWRSEVQDLLSQISELQKDNRKLLSRPQYEPLLSEEPPPEQDGASQREREVLDRLRKLVEKQRDEIRSKEHELTLRSRDIEALQLQQNRLMKMNQDLRHRLALLETRGKALVQQRAELEAVAQARLQELGTLGQEVSRLQRELQDMDIYRREERVHVTSGPSAAGSSSATGAPPLTAASPAGPASEEKPSSVWVECAGDPEFLATCFEQAPLTRDCENDVAVLQLSDTDSDGQEDSPRFTLQELRDVLHEKNQLKAQVFLLQEELAYYSTIFTAIMPMVAAGLISDDPTLMPIRRLVSIT